MNDRDKAELQRRLRKLLKLMYLTSLGAAHIYRGHARRAGERRERLLQHAAEQVERRDEAAALLRLLGKGKPWQRPIWHVTGWCWGRLSALTGREFSLHMLANIEHEAQKITRAADAVARELVILPVVEALVRMARAEAARKEWLVEELRRESRNAGLPDETLAKPGPVSNDPNPEPRISNPETRD